MQISLGFLTFAVATVIAMPATAQRPTALGSPTATFPEPFSNITGIRELSDGRVLLADQLERHVSFIDFASGNVQQIGREGEGPGEYATPSGLIALPNDGTLLVDFGNMRLTRIEANGRLTDVWPIMRDDGTFVRPRVSDEEGRLYFSTSGVFTMRRGAGQRSEEPPDSTPIQRWDPATGRIDTVGMLETPRPRITTQRSSSGGMRFTGAMAQPFAPADDWGLATDGRVVVARASNYRLDWYRDGRSSPGPRLDYQPIPVTNREKNAWADRQAEQRATMRVMGSGGGRSETFQMARPDIDEIDFPAHKPPFEGNAVQMTPWGEVWVERTRAHDETNALFDVLDGTGRLTGQIQLPEGRQLIGFGRNSVFLVRADADDLQWLERYER